MAALSAQQITEAGVTPTFAAAAGGGDTAPVGDKTFLVVKNGGGSSITVTLAAFPNTSAFGTTIPDPTVTVANGSEKWIGPLRGASYADPSTGRCAISYSAVTSVTVGVITL